jgi:predicted phage terminase large subunit-like protein
MPAVSEDRVESFSVNGEPVVETRRRALWPSRWNLAELDKKRRLVGEYDWSALYQGEPRPKGGRLFQAATRYQFANIVEGKEPCKIVIGADPAATEKTNADYSAIVVASFTGSWDKEDPSNTENLGFRGDILEVWRGQVTVPEFVKRLRDIAVKWGAPIAVEAVAGFKAVPQMLRQLDKTLKIIEAPAVGDKFTRSLPVSAAWNYGRVRIPDDVANNPWVHDFLAEIEKFTGVKDKHDDQVDALAHAYNAAQTLMPAVVKRTPVHRPSFLPFG